MDIRSKFNMEDIYMGFIAEGKCECGNTTFSADEICARCKLDMAEADRRFFDPEKRCSKCRQIKSIEAFYKNRSQPDGLNNQCKDCHTESTRTWRSGLSKGFLTEQVRAWRESNPERFKAISASITARNRAKKFGVRSTATWRDFLILHQQPCFHCGVTPSNGADHIIPFVKDGENTPENLQPACLDCNRLKNRTDVDAFMTLRTDDCG